ncbi:Ig-like domain-containing protein, partial [Alistipes sp. ZOR0009]|uniref:Ig-like domain-containing protein n=1 Tax=Alistipes sp. ZOR0009 TaxID=1339253 RepID=UPI0018CE8E09
GSLVNVDPDKLVGVGTILDNDGAPTLSVGDATVAEGGKLQFVVSLSAASGKAVTVKASTADGSATTADNDYTSVSNLAVTFAPGEVSKVVEVPTMADTKFESDETIALELTDATNATIADGSATGTITNDDATPAISVADATAIEGDKLRFRITLDKVSDNEVSVNIGLQDITTSSSDYSALPSITVTFAAGDLEKWVEVSTLKDAIVEGNEQVKLVLSGATNATIAVPEAIGTITDVMVKPLNFDFEVSGTEDSPVSIPKNGFADNFDKDYKTELLKVKIESLPENGSLVLNGSPVKVGDEISSADLDMLTFIPTPNWNGETSFKWKGQNSAGYADVPAVVTIKIAGVNDLPEATNDSFMIDEKALLSGNLAANDKLSGDGGNTFTLVGLPAHGEVILNSDGSFTYTQKGGYAANDSFTYKLCDANGDCSTASVNIVITQIINNIKPPVAANDNATTKGDTPVTISVLANDSDPDSQLLPETLTILDQPQHGTVVVNGDGTVTYTANKGYVGEDTFTYRICDNGNPQMCATATVNVTVSGLDVKIPDGFSPNGDGVNDRFVIKGLETYPNNVLRIFNRWGNIVYQMKGYDNSWDGKNGGKGLHIGVDLPDGTYYYILDLGDGSKPQTSFVVIKR